MHFSCGPVWDSGFSASSNHEHIERLMKEFAIFSEKRSERRFTPRPPFYSAVIKNPGIDLHIMMYMDAPLCTAFFIQDIIHGSIHML